jgi:hypothetical protein
MITTLPVPMHAVGVKHLTMNAMLVVMMVSIDRSLTKYIEVGWILSDLFRTPLAAYMVIETNHLVSR